MSSRVKRKQSSTTRSKSAAMKDVKTKKRRNASRTPNAGDIESARAGDTSSTPQGFKIGTNNRMETVYECDKESEHVFVFAHGAGAGKDHEWMKTWSAKLASVGSVHAFNYPYMQGDKRRPPNRMPKLVAYHLKYLVGICDMYEHKKVVLIGKSMGSRVSCHVTEVLGKLQRRQQQISENSSASSSSRSSSSSSSRRPKTKKRRVASPEKKDLDDHEKDLSKLDEDLKEIGLEGGIDGIDATGLLSRITAVICLAYPYQAPSGKLRDQVLLNLPSRVLFIQGSRDKMSPNEKLRETMKVMRNRDRNKLVVIETGDHSLQVLKRGSQMTQDEADEKIFQHIKVFTQ